MTQNQIAYWNLRESERHNVVGEAETSRHNVATETETKRHNLVTEQQQMMQLNESIRHNQVAERQQQQSINIQAGNLAESVRHNQANEYYSMASLSEQQRHSLATEMETSLHNRTTESLQSQQNAETKRHNVETERNASNQTRINAYSAKVQEDYNKQVANAKRLENALRAQGQVSEADRVEQLVLQTESQLKRAKNQNTTDVWNSVNNSVNSLSKLLESVGSLINK